MCVYVCYKEFSNDSLLFRTKCFKSTYDLVNEYNASAKKAEKFNLCASIHDTELNETILTGIFVYVYSFHVFVLICVCCLHRSSDTFACALHF